MDYIGWAWLCVIVVCVVIETATMGLTTIWFAFGAIVAWLSSSLGFDLNVQIVLFLIISILCLVVTRPIAVKKLKIGKTRTNADSIIGECVKVITTINNINNEGTVKARGQIWEARAYNNDEIIEKDEIVCVREIIGVKLIVERKK